jgi:hypothetical protein
MRKLKYLAAGFAVLCECSSAMRAAEYTSITVKNWMEIREEICARFPGERSESAIFIDCDGVVVDYDDDDISKLADQNVASVLRDLEIAGWKIVMLTSRDNVWGKLRTRSQLEALGVSFRSPISDDYETNLQRAWENGRKIDCDREGGIFFTRCSPNRAMSDEKLARFSESEEKFPEAISLEDVAFLDEAVEQASLCGKGKAIHTIITYDFLTPRPRELVFIDDDLENVKSVESAFRVLKNRDKHDIDTLLIHFDRPDSE